MAVKTSAKKVESKSAVVKASVSRVKEKPKTVSKSSATMKNSLPTHSSVKNTSSKSVKSKKLYVTFIVVIAILGLGLYYMRGMFVAAVVNGQPISRLEVVKETEKQKGKETLAALVRNNLIQQEAAKNKVSVSDKEVGDEIKRLEGVMSKQGQKLDDALAMQAMTRDDLKKLIRLDKLVSKMVSKDVRVSDEEVSAYIEKNKDVLPKDADEAKMKSDVKESLRQQKTSEKVRTWLADLEKRAKVIYFVQY